MKALNLSGYLLMCACALSGAAQAQVFACQETLATGFSWKGGRWQSTDFKLDAPFFLKVEGGYITRESAAKVINGSIPSVACSSRANVFLDGSTRRTGTVHTCQDYSTYLTWSPDSGNGTLAKTYGGFQSSSAPDRDTVTVTLFTCQQM